MIEGTLYINGAYDNASAIGFWFAPSKAEIEKANNHYTFRDDNYRIHALIVMGSATMEQCRLFAQHFVEGKAQRIDMNDAKTIDRYSALWIARNALT